MTASPDPYTAPPLLDAMPCPGGVELWRAGERVNRLSVIEARRLAERLLAAARETEHHEFLANAKPPQDVEVASDAEVAW